MHFQVVALAFRNAVGVLFLIIHSSWRFFTSHKWFNSAQYSGVRCKNLEEMMQKTSFKKDDSKTISTPAILRAFLQLGVSSISDALKATRFIVGSKRKLLLV